MKTASSIAAMVLAASTLLACGGQGSTSGHASGQPAKQHKQGEVVATVGNDVITVDEFKARLDEQSPFIRARYNNLERKKEFLDNMVRFEVLAQEAQRRGLDKDPDVIAAAKKVMVQKLMRDEFDENKAAQEISEEELKAFYEQHVDDYVKPERLRVSHVFLAAEKGSADRAKVKREATQLLADVRGKEAGPIKTAFAEAAKSRSDDTATRAAGGDLLFKTHEELTEAWGKPFADAVAAIQNIGEIGTLVETDKGFHLVKLTGRQNALDRPFETVKSQIQNRLFREKRTNAFEEFVNRLKENAKVQVNDEVLARIDVGVPAEDAPTGAAAEIAPTPAPAPAAAPAAAPSSAPTPMRAPAGDAKNGLLKLRSPTGKEVSVPGSLDHRRVKELLQKGE